MKIGIPASIFMSWQGGIDFLWNISQSLLSSELNHDIVIFLPVKGKKFYTRQFLRFVYRFLRFLVGKNNHASLSKKDFYEVFSNIDSRVKLIEIDYGERALFQNCKLYNIDCLIPSLVPLQDRFSIPWVGYIFDLQYKHLPQYFAKREIKERDNGIKNMLQPATSIIVNAKDVKNDLVKFFNADDKVIYPIPFSASPTLQLLDNINCLPNMYHDKPYFICCNQFWMHKDHITLFKGFKKLVNEFDNINLICTGLMEDYRNPSYLDQLREFLSSNDLTKKVMLLGLVPKINQLSLMKHAIALVQPTLLEGGPGGGSVYDAVSLNVPAIVSDIPVNLELEEENIFFFKKSDSEDLYLKMKEMLAFDREDLTDKDLIARGSARRKNASIMLDKAIFKAINS